MPHSSIVEWLSGGDRRQLGPAEAVASEVTRHNERFEELFEAILCDDPVVRMRAADAAEKITRARPDLLVPFRARLIDEAGAIDQHEVRWHVAQMLPRVRLNPKERSRAIALLERYLADESAIVVASTISALGDFAMEDAGLRKRLMPSFERLAKTGSPAVAVRAKKTLAKFESAQNRGVARPQPRR